jgi:hypothetical protein
VPVHDYVLNMYVDYLTSDEYLPAFEAGAEYIKKLRNFARLSSSERIYDGLALAGARRWHTARYRSLQQLT